ncbi:MAG TPA: bifunctional UDP-3-O-[3-hydroxymyristoyl] N-acetylglucosamine deacetylase/3-hydroxyacyl-ACP dehydratase [Saprospiraceae bacterium]|nr:bifunctional UDP-3-O-[3-hydroxymyristoyl] N-acetylglucosamine deacetylase/3-hydroxyacyl-ACP dehydratase [Saprospiraceae bacterium]
MKQHTIIKEVSISGVGLHSGKEATLTIKPAEENTGFVFKRVDLEGAPAIPAKVRYVVETNRSTTLGKGKATIMTVEHLLAALTGMELDNAILEVSGPEIPILNGSAAPFMEILAQAGRQEQDAERKCFVVKEPITFVDEESGAEFMAFPSEKFEITSMIDFNSKVLGQQFAQLNDIQDFKDEIAACRTFVFLREVAYLADQNLIKGGDLDNAIVIVDEVLPEQEMLNLAEKLDRPALTVTDSGILNNIELQYKNEPARHKLLDIVGDLTLLGAPIQGKIVAKKPGHRVNTEFVKVLNKYYQEQLKLGDIPKYDPDIPPLYDTVAVQKILPHRHPFLLVDKILTLSEKDVVGVKNVTHDQYFFPGHFPNNPILPGVLQIEAMAQTGGILALSTTEDPENWDTFFLKISEAKFKHFVVPGDTMVIKMELLSEIRRGICQMRGTIYVGNKITTEADLTAIIKRRKNDDS